MIEAGRYSARAVEGALGVAGTGKEQVAVAFKITDEGPFKGHVITWYGYFTDATADRTIESLRHCGWQGDNLAELVGIQDNEVSIEVQDKQGNDGKVYAEVRWVNRGGGALQLKERLDPGAALAFARKMRGAVIAQRTKGGAAAGPAQRPAAQQRTQRQAPATSNGGDFGDDDIPFRQPFVLPA